MANADYDKKKFVKDTYGNFLPKQRKSTKGEIQTCLVVTRWALQRIVMYLREKKRYDKVIEGIVTWVKEADRVASRRKVRKSDYAP